MKNKMKKLVLAAITAGMLAGCTAKQNDVPTAGPLEAPEYTMEITGIAAKFDDGTLMVISEKEGPVVLTGSMNFEGIQTGDHLRVYTGDLMETYPAQAEAVEMMLSSRGTAEDLPQAEMEKLLSMGYEMKDYAVKNTYTSITMDEAMQLFAQEGDYIILDVRRADEYASGHIPGAVNYANEDIQDTPPAVLPDQNQLIYVYCRSGNRSKQACEKLVKMGYTNIVEFGGIIDWKGDVIAD